MKVLLRSSVNFGASVWPEQRREVAVDVFY
jgi:hypothetical protein